MTEKKKQSKIANVLILATILALPGFLYAILEHKGSNSYKPLPVYGEKSLTGTFTKRMGEEIPDTLFHTVDSFRLINQDGAVIQYPFSDTTITIVNFFYTGCESFCKHMNDEMERVSMKVVNQKSVRLLTISVDTLNDTPEVLKAYSAEYMPQERKWHFLTGRGDGLSNVFELANQQFLLNAVQDPADPTKFVHSSSIVMLDSRNRIRGIYDINRPKEVDRLIDEIKLQLVEEIRLRSPY